MAKLEVEQDILKSEGPHHKVNVKTNPDGSISGDYSHFGEHHKTDLHALDNMVSGGYSHFGEHHKTDIHIDQDGKIDGGYSHFGDNHKFEVKFEGNKPQVSYTTNIDKDHALNLVVDEHGPAKIGITKRF